MKFERGIGILALLISLLLIGAFIAFSIYIVRLDNVVRNKFEGQRWDIPAKVFARPLEIYNQAPISKADFIQELQLLGYSASDNYTKTGHYVSTGNTIFVHTRGFNFGDQVEPEQVLKVGFDQSQVIQISATKPNASGIARLEPLLIGGIYPQHNEDRVLIKLNKVPKPLIEALIATEDRNFYQHHGISIRGTARALVSNATGGKRQGGSTLTQQLVKNFYLSPEKTLKRKVNEAFMAILIELHYDKDEILETYLNEVHLAQNGNYSINGYGLAAQFYFGLPLRELNIAQQAFLVGLVQGPSLYNPWRNPESALKRRNIVLNNMLVMGYLNQENYEREKARPLGVIAKPTLSPARYPDFLDLVRRQLRTEYQLDNLTNQGLQIFTTLDPIAQTRVEKSFKNSVQQLSKKNPQRLKNLQGAVLVSRPENGELVAAVGSTQDFTGFNRAIDAKRQVGSLLKPVIYLTALESGRYTWASKVNDANISIQTNSNETWTPKNYSGGEYGAVPMVKALAQSYNLSAVRLGQEFGLTTFSNYLYKLGVTSKIPSGYPSIFLGAVDLSPFEILKVYSNFATGGTLHSPTTIRSVVDKNGYALERFSFAAQQTIDSTSAYILNHGLQQVMQTGTGRAAYNSLSRDLQLAGKSGTTNDTRDSWFAGYSGNYVSVVWLGLDDNKVTGLTGSTGALPVWTDVMKQLRQKPVDLIKPDQVTWHWVDPETGYLSAEHCANALYIPLQRRAIPRHAIPCAIDQCQVEESESTQPTQVPQPESQPPVPETYNDPWLEESNAFDPNQNTVISNGAYSSENEL